MIDKNESRSRRIELLNNLIKDAIDFEENEKDVERVVNKLGKALDGEDVSVCLSAAAIVVSFAISELQLHTNEVDLLFSVMRGDIH